MAVKEWFRQLQPVQLYIVLFLTLVFFISELVVSHVTHALTLLLDSYHMLCNIIALSGCIITIKYRENIASRNQSQQEETSSSASVGEELSSKAKDTSCSDVQKTAITARGIHQGNKLKNTFGWARIDVVVMLICCVFLASLCFSIWVEALQTLAHIDHHDEMHHPIPVLIVGAVGLLLNGLCYLLIGGFTFHQGSFLYVTESGDVILNKVVTSGSVKNGERRLSRTRATASPMQRQRQGFREMLRDVVGCIFVIACSLLVNFTEKNTAKFIDPILSIASATLLIILSYPYMKESCLILLQTMPDTINIESLKTQLTETFPDIINVHDLHIWQLTASKVISTAHIIFQNPKVYAKITDKVTELFLEHGITQVTIQPEFFTKAGSTESLASAKTLCLMQCQSEGCKTSHCCPTPVKNPELSKWKHRSKESLADDQDVSVVLKSIKVEGQPPIETARDSEIDGNYSENSSLNKSSLPGTSEESDNDCDLKKNTEEQELQKPCPSAVITAEKTADQKL